MTDDGWRLAPGVVRLRDRRLAGGSPFRVVRLSLSGAGILDSLTSSGDHPPDGTPAAVLADRLARYGMLLAPPLSPVPVSDVTVVIPARSTPAAVEALLAALPDEVPVVLVDDGSTEPLHDHFAARRGLVQRRHPVSKGASTARNVGAALAVTRWIAFVDTDVAPGPDCLGRLCAYGRMPDVVAVAPRIVSSPSPGLRGLVETSAGGLDLGPTPADVRAGRVVSYVPSAVLLVDRGAFERVGGFDESLSVAEDVDLVWRLRSQGLIRYQPEIVVTHTPRRSLVAVLRRRHFYGTGAAQLDERHPGVVRHADVSVWSFGPWLVGVLVDPAAGLLAGAATVAAAPLLLEGLPPRDARRLAVRAHLAAGVALGRWTIRPLWPATLVLALSRPRRRRALAVASVAGYLGLAWHAARDPCERSGIAGGGPRGLVRTAAGSVLAHTLDDLAYSLGVWDGCLRARRIGPLLAVIRLPLPGRTGRTERRGSTPNGRSYLH